MHKRHEKILRTPLFHGTLRQRSVQQCLRVHRLEFLLFDSRLVTGI
ncbi:MAG: hypothetical protein ACREHD_22590 [Pirellulales bacterium]